MTKNGIFRSSTTAHFKKVLRFDSSMSLNGLGPRADVINKFHCSSTALYWIKALWLDVENLMTIFNQS